MRRVFKRVAFNGLLTALVLGLIGLCFAEMAGLWLTGAGGTRSAPDPAVQDGLRHRVPLTMAVWGFLFIAVTEFGLFLWRGDPSAKVAKKEAGPDEGELLLEELLRQAEAKTALEQGSGGSDQRPEEAGEARSDEAKPELGAPIGVGSGMLPPRPEPQPLPNHAPTR